MAASEPAISTMQTATKAAPRRIMAVPRDPVTLATDSRALRLQCPRAGPACKSRSTKAFGRYPCPGPDQAPVPAGCIAARAGKRDPGLAGLVGDDGAVGELDAPAHARRQAEVVGHGNDGLAVPGHQFAQDVEHLLARFRIE